MQFIETLKVHTPLKRAQKKKETFITLSSSKKVDNTQKNVQISLYVNRG